MAKVIVDKGKGRKCRLSMLVRLLTKERVDKAPYMVVPISPVVGRSDFVIRVCDTLRKKRM